MGDALNISYRMVTQCVQRVMGTQPVTTPNKRREKRRVKREVDSFTGSAIRSLIYEMARNGK